MWCEKEEDSLQFHTKVVPTEIDIQRSLFEAAESIDEYANGGKIAFFLSGGFDSQLSYNCLKSVGFDFDVFMIDLNGENQYDFERAKQFAALYDVEHTVLQIDPFNFFENDFLSIIDNNEVTSPQWALHCKAYEMVKERGYEMVINGGDSLQTNLSETHYMYTLDSSMYCDSMNWCENNDMKMVRYLSWTPEIAFYFARKSSVWPKMNAFSKLGFSFVAYSSTGFRQFQSKLSKRLQTVNAADTIYRNFARKKNKYYHSKNKDSFLLLNGEKINVRQYPECKIQNKSKD